MKVLIEIFCFHSRKVVELGDDEINKGSMYIGYQEILVLTEDNK